MTIYKFFITRDNWHAYHVDIHAWFDSEPTGSPIEWWTGSSITPTFPINIANDYKIAALFRLRFCDLLEPEDQAHKTIEEALAKLKS